MGTLQGLIRERDAPVDIAGGFGVDAAKHDKKDNWLLSTVTLDLHCIQGPGRTNHAVQVGIGFGRGDKASAMDYRYSKDVKHCIYIPVSRCNRF